MKHNKKSSKNEFWFRSQQSIEQCRFCSKKKNDSHPLYTLYLYTVIPLVHQIRNDKYLSGKYPIVAKNIIATYKINLPKNILKTINWTLFQKYSQSQIYYYTRDINQILSSQSYRPYISYKDWLVYDQKEEYLKRFYETSDHQKKLDMLTIYYKYHKDLPRMYMEPQANILNKYLDKKRKFEYYRIAKLIEQENQNNPSKPPKGIVGEKPSPVHSIEKSQEKKKFEIQSTLILKDLSFLKKDISQTLQEICEQIRPCEPSNFDLDITTLIEKEKLSQFIKHIEKQEKNSFRILTTSPVSFKQKYQSPYQQIESIKNQYIKVRGEMSQNNENLLKQQLRLKLPKENDLIQTTSSSPQRLDLRKQNTERIFVMKRKSQGQIDFVNSHFQNREVTTLKSSRQLSIVPVSIQFKLSNKRVRNSIPDKIHKQS